MNAEDVVSRLHQQPPAEPVRWTICLSERPLRGMPSAGIRSGVGAPAERSEKEPSRKSGSLTTRIFIALGSILLVLFCCIALGITGWVYGDRIVMQLFPTEVPPTPTPTLPPTSVPTPSPHILVHEPPTGTTVLEEYFDANNRQWVSYYARPSKVQDGMLKFWSSQPGYVNTVWCKGCGIYAHTYYLQADVKTEDFSLVSYGLAFSINENNNYYIFMINHNKFTYTLIKLVNDEWFTLIEATPYDELQGHPHSNTLSVFFDEGNIELYINGARVSNYIDPDPFLEGRIGMIIDDKGGTMLVDNVFAYSLR